MSAFDAKAARALANRVHTVVEILADMKAAVVAACQRGLFETVVALPDPQRVPAGSSANNAGFLLDHLEARQLHAWAEAVRHAVQAGYTAGPNWRPLDYGAACDGVALAWSAAMQAPDGTPRLMSAHAAWAMSRSTRAQHAWVEQAQEVIKRAAVKGATHCLVPDEGPAADEEAWSMRRELLGQAGFSTEVVAVAGAPALRVSW